MERSRHRSDFTPIYATIKEDLKQRIASGELRPGDPIEPRHKLMEMYGTSWATVHRAVSELVLEGWLVAAQGKGTFVAQRALHREVKVLLLNEVSTWHDSLLQMMEGIRTEAHARYAAVSYIEVPEGRIAEWDLDGHIAVVPSEADRRLLDAAAEKGARFVVLGSDYPERPLLPCVNADTRAGVEEAMQYLISEGHRHVGLIGVVSGFPNYQREVKGYRKALQEAGIDVNPDYILYRTPDGADLVQSITEWYARHPQITAIFAADYTSGLATLSFARRAKLDVPRDLSVLCMDELPVSGMLPVALTTVRQPFVELGKLAVRRLLTALEGHPVRGLQSLPCELIIRDSIAKVSARPRAGSSVPGRRATGWPE